MSVSLLYKLPEEPRSLSFAENLMLGRTAALFCPDLDIQKAAINRLTAPPRLYENMRYRQEICADFLRSPALLTGLAEHARKNDELALHARAARRQNAGIVSRSGFKREKESNIEESPEILVLEVNADACLRWLELLKSADELFAAHDFKSEGLAALAGNISNFVNSREYYPLYNAVATLRGISSHNLAQLRLGLDEKLRPIFASLCRLASGGQAASRSGKKAGSTVQIRTEKKALREATDFLLEAAEEASALLVGINKALCEMLSGLTEELWLYLFAMRYHEACENAGLSLCLPELLPPEEDVLELTEVRDLFLSAAQISQTGRADAVVPGSVRLGGDRRGVLISGDNNTGKTVFLRCIGSTVVFAQSGLPIPARRARISARSGVFAQFARSEETFLQGDTAGRFEAEARDIAEILGAVEPYSLLLLNETFQTTDYDEASDAMRDILEALSRAGVKWIFVSHLTRLFGLMRGKGGVAFMRTGAGGGPYRLTEYEPGEEEQ